MNTKTILMIVTLAAMLSSGPVLATGYHDSDHYNDYDNTTERARVVEVTSIRVLEQVPVSYRECRDEEVWHRSRGGGVSAGEGLIAGTIIGGVIGNQAVKGHGRRSATIAGTVIGAMVGHAVASDDDAGYYRTVEQRCELRRDYREEERIVGYDVTYRYCGKEYTTRMDHDPGKWIRVRVEPY